MVRFGQGTLSQFKLGNEKKERREREGKARLCVVVNIPPPNIKLIRSEMVFLSFSMPGVHPAFTSSVMLGYSLSLS